LLVSEITASPPSPLADPPPTRQTRGSMMRRDAQQLPDCSATPSYAAATMGMLGSIMAVVLFAVPISVMREVVRAGDVKRYSIIPYLMSACCCGMWVVYAQPYIAPCKPQVLVTNMIGSVLEVSYIIIFLAHAADRQQELFIQTGCALVIFLLLFVLGTSISPEFSFEPPHFPGGSDNVHDSRRRFVLGVICVSLNMLMYASPLSIVRDVVRTKSVEYMPLPLSLATLACAISWVAWGFIALDGFVLVCNLAGIALAAVQILIYLVYARVPDGPLQARADPLIAEYKPSGQRATGAPKASTCNKQGTEEPLRSDTTGSTGLVRSCLSPGQRIIEV